MRYNFSRAAKRHKKQNEKYLSWLTKWENKHDDNVSLLPYNMQYKHLEHPPCVLKIQELFENNVEDSIIYKAIEAFKQRIEIQGALFHQLKNNIDPRNNVWKQHLYLNLSRSTAFQPPNMTSLLYDNTNLQWILDSIDYASSRVDEALLEDATLSLYSNIGIYLENMNQTLEESLDDMPSSWLIASAWDGTVETTHSA